MIHITKKEDIIDYITRENERTGGIFRLAPTWVARPGIVQPGRRIKLYDDYISQDLAVNERWLASVTYADNGIYNSQCPKDHGYSYIVIENKYKILLKDAITYCREIMLGDKEEWDVLPKFFDNWHRIPFHMHPCDEHVKDGLTGKPESYHFPIELNMNKNAFPATPIGVDPVYTDNQILDYLRSYFKGDNRLTDLANTINLIPGTGYFMPACTLHAPGSLVTYELQVASDVSCIPESRVNDMCMPPDLIDRDLPVTIEKDGMEEVSKFMLRMINCKDSGNKDQFRKEYFRPPVNIIDNENISTDYVIYRCGRASEKENKDLYSAKKTVVKSGANCSISEKGAFGAIVLRGSGDIKIKDREAVFVESASIYMDRDECFSDEIFVSANAAGNLQVKKQSSEPLTFYQHFGSRTNPESASLNIPEYLKFGGK